MIMHVSWGVESIPAQVTYRRLHVACIAVNCECILSLMPAVRVLFEFLIRKTENPANTT
jgi:hypothetical protein